MVQICGLSPDFPVEHVVQAVFVQLFCAVVEPDAVAEADLRQTLCAVASVEARQLSD